MNTPEMQTFILQVVCIISALILLLLIVVYIIKPWLQHCFVQRQKKLDFEQKKEIEYQLLAMSKVKIENQRIDSLTKGKSAMLKEIEHLKEELKKAPDEFERVALIYRLLQKETELTADEIRKHQKEIENIFKNLENSKNKK